MDKSFKKEEVAAHNKETDCWVIVGDSVYNVTKFLPIHPGGKKLILDHAGDDMTAAYQAAMGGNARANAILKSLRIGALAKL
jgi:cytochrome b involved in lipid metabolism